MLKKECHFIRDYFKKKREDKEKSQSDGDLSITSTNNEVAKVLIVFVRQNSLDWVLDFGCTFHMCPNQSWFNSYNKIDGGQVLLGNNMTCQVVGIGKVQIQLKDDTIKTLTAVRHVPALKRSLISLGVFNGSGQACKTKNGNMKITRGSYVAMREVKKNGLYILLRKTAISPTEPVVVAKVPKDQTML